MTSHKFWLFWTLSVSRSYALIIRYLCHKITTPLPLNFDIIYFIIHKSFVKLLAKIEVHKSTKLRKQNFVFTSITSHWSKIIRRIFPNFNLPFGRLSNASPMKKLSPKKFISSKIKVIIRKEFNFVLWQFSGFTLH